MKSMWFVTRGYPTKENSSFAFLQPVIREIADRGIDCTVIAPQPIRVNKLFRQYRPYCWKDTTDQGNTITIYQPKYLALPNVKFAGIQLNIFGRENAVKRFFKKMADRPDVVYCHFWDCVMMAARSCLKGKIPLIAVTGESSIDVAKLLSKKRINNRLKAVKGVICVSSKNQKESKSLGLIGEDIPSIVSPNAIDTQLFFQTDKTEERKKLGIKEEDFVISYVGRFSERKGVNRLVEATRRISAAKLILIGYGGDVNESNQILVKKRVAHEDVVHYLNASDVYCLPTLAEGCCNSIVEAMACGLPIVSSDMEFNDDILDDTNSIRVNPSNIEEIGSALERLYQGKELRNRLSQNAYIKAKNMTIEKRIDNILSFIFKIVEETHG